jgi:hypothetical protein
MEAFALALKFGNIERKRDAFVLIGSISFGTNDWRKNIVIVISKDACFKDLILYSQRVTGTE